MCTAPMVLVFIYRARNLIVHTDSQAHTLGAHETAPGHTWAVEVGWVGNERGEGTSIFNKNLPLARSELVCRLAQSMLLPLNSLQRSLARALLT